MQRPPAEVLLDALATIARELPTVRRALCLAALSLIVLAVLAVLAVAVELLARALSLAR